MPVTQLLVKIMETKQMLCWSALALVIVVFIYLGILGKKQSKKDKKFIEEMMGRNGWKRTENPNKDAREWVTTELKAGPAKYSVFGPVNEWYWLSSIHRNEMDIDELWTKQDGDRLYFVLHATDWYYTPVTRGSGKRSVDLTIIGMRAPVSLPFFTLFPKMEFPKTMGWRYSISETHDLNLSNKINESALDLKESAYTDHRVRQPLVLPNILQDDEKPAPRAVDPPMTIGSEAFNERFELYGKETERVRQFFDDERLTALESLPQTFVDAGGELIFVYIPEHRPKVADLEKFINDRIVMINAVRHEPKRQTDIEMKPSEDIQTPWTLEPKTNEHNP